MARQEINIGLVPGDGRGDKLRIGGIKINENFLELYNWLSSVQSVPVISGYHLIPEQQVNLLAALHQVIPAPGTGKVTELVSTIARSRLLPVRGTCEETWFDEKGERKSVKLLELKFDGKEAAEKFLEANRYNDPSGIVGSPICPSSENVSPDRFFNGCMIPDCVWDHCRQADSASS